MPLPPEQQADLQAQLQAAVSACNDRCLFQAAKWVAELLNSLPTTASNDLTTDDASDTEIDDDDAAKPTTTATTTNHDRKEARREAKELHKYQLAQSLFHCREFDRCAAVFLPTPVPHINSASQQAVSAAQLQSTPKKTSLQSPRSSAKLLKPQQPPLPNNLSQKALFLALYAKYMSGEKRKIEDSETILGPVDGPVTANKAIPGVLAILEEYFNARGGLQNMENSQGWLDYLYGIVLVRTKSEALAKQWLLRSVNLNPYNWSAWLELASLIGSVDEMRQVSAHLPENIIKFLFYIHCGQELYLQTPEVYHSLAQVTSIFPSSPFLAQQKAVIAYHARDYDTAMATFDALLHAFPHRLEGTDIYSNLLFVLPNRPKLATLAATASETDKFRPETSCILGNYYSLMAEHEKAVLCFRRALMLDRTFQAAWTLMGHEYIELKNTQAAIESYRRAVDINRKDYRAWYGLGQGYEMLELHSYSLFYYQRVAALCPHDPKMWAAMGNAYARCGKLGNAIQAYKRALQVGSQMDLGGSSFGSGGDALAHAVGGALDPQVLFDIALLYERDDNYEEAAAYMQLCLDQEEGLEEGEEGIGVTQITSRARLWLAKWTYGCGDWQRTMELANELCQDGVEVEEAKGLVRDVRARLALREAAEDEEEQWEQTS